MARPSRFVHPFRAVRDMMGLSQEKAAEALGISRSTLKQIETGILPLSQEISDRMRALTGVKIRVGVCNKTVAPVAWDDSRYDENTLKRYREYSDARYEQRASAKLGQLEILLKLAARKKRLGPVVVALNEVLWGDLIPHFKLFTDDDLDLLTDAEAVKLFGVTKEEYLRWRRGVTKEEYSRWQGLPAPEELPKPKKSAGSKKPRP